MEINWFTFAAQIVNFLVLVVLLKRFLYRPIVNAMDKREQAFADRMEEADERRREADEAAAEFQTKNQELEHAREELLAQAAREIEDWRKEHLEKARQDVEHNRTEWYRAVQRERDSFLQEMRRRAGRQVHEMARHVLQSLSGADLERQIIDAFLQRLEHLEQDKRREITASIRNSRKKILVDSAFDIPDEGRSRILQIVRDQLADGAQIEFKTVPELICGIELKAAGYKVAWSAGESLESLQEDFEKALNEAIPQ